MCRVRPVSTVGPRQGERGPGLSWQEELRKLDEELATGRISADDYRVRRDGVLSSAAGTSSPEERAQQPGQAENTTFIAPVPQQPPPGERTQVVSNQGNQGQPTDERTQVVGNNAWQTTRPPSNESDAERTQIVPGLPPRNMQQSGPYPPPNYVQQQQQQQLPPWQGQHQHSQRSPQHPQQSGNDDLAPPWAGSEFPPLAASGNADWIRQGPEVFESGGSGKSSKIAIIAVAVLLVAGLGVGAFVFFGKDSGDDPQPQANVTETTTAPPTTTSRPKDDLEVAELPGKQDQTAHIKTFADVEASQILTPEEAAVYTKVEAGGCRLATSLLPGGVNAYVLSTRATTPEGATTTVTGLAALQVKYGMVARTDVPAGVTVADIDKAESRPALLRAHYAHKGTVVRIQIHGDDLAKVREAFDTVIQEQLKVLPVNA